MRKIILFVHMSLDGFVAGPGGEMDWISTTPDLFEFVEKRVQQTDCALYGRRTFQMMQGYWPTAAEQPGASRHDIEHARWYASARKVVLSRSLTQADAPGASLLGGELKREIEALKAESEGEVLMFGSPGAAHALMKLDLLDGYWLFVNPVLLGAGVALFGRPAHLERLRLLSTAAFPSGVICLDYERADYPHSP
ncbi:dihydrofolate reductase family protein [Deinococcus sp.]|uniref:dihydrofolate reductase family protein n=1 Tax=Deinococcus sp. TaxID=47478 RepID=UPI0025D3B40C|nr:dihydrofolate reductase family protein [Deinococcus sp.]